MPSEEFDYGPYPLEGLPEIPPFPGNGLVMKPKVSAGMAATILNKYGTMAWNIENDDTVRVLKAFLGVLKGPLRNFLVEAIPRSPVYASSQLMPCIGCPSRCPTCGEPEEISCPCKDGVHTPLDPRTRSGLFVLRRQALIRENYACVATGRPSLNYHQPFAVTDIRHLGEPAHLAHIYRPKIVTSIAHIVPLALDPFRPTRNETHKKNKAAIWLALRRNFPILACKFHPTRFGMVGPANTLMLGHELSDLFTHFRYFVQHTQERRVCNIFLGLAQASLTELGRRGIPNISRIGRDGAIPPPDPDLLVFHPQFC
ncbi:hypothetical protein B0T14DRAFT_604987 [Immersiella caudata]|uniref:Uncharacterized protein n=1 Tax=Immersiella caudata TaxID=314043 RepID=A0AA40BX37_9PEZI|nr:hypothetical protein B0T14DRAFT_604987 [Immersiella caudata]